MAAETYFRAMGTSVHVLVHGDPALLAFARERIDHLERRWSRFLATSEVSALNALAGTPVVVSDDTVELVAAAVDAWRATNGRFDPTVLGDVLRAGYDTSYEIVATRGGLGSSTLQHGCGGIRFDRVTCIVELPAGVGFDPGGIGKGLAADLVADELLAAGALGACVNIGGDVRVEGLAPDDGSWVVAIEEPVSDREIAAVRLGAGGVATSTTARRTWTAGRATMHHIIDPDTGSPAVSEIVSATAISRSARSAEVMAKAAVLAPAESALDAITVLGGVGLVVDRHGLITTSPGFAAFAPDHVAPREAL
ncbi:MAG: FAD:protein FMN transferase [Acidimicrobiia bacterium]